MKVQRQEVQTGHTPCIAALLYLNIVVHAGIAHGMDNLEGVVQTLFSSGGVGVHVFKMCLDLWSSREDKS